MVTQLDRVINQLAFLASGDGTIDFPEFLQMMKKKSSEQDQLDVRLCVVLNTDH